MRTSASVRTAGVLAVKPLTDAKSRLARAYPDATVRSALVLAMLADTVTAMAAAGVHPIAVVSRDPRVRDTTLALGAIAIDDTASTLNSAVRLGISAMRSWAPEPDRILVMQADLPCATPEHIHQILAATTGRSFLADHSGDGTTLVVLPVNDATPTRFGPDSARAHRTDFDELDGTGHYTCEGRRWSDLRLDIDTQDDLNVAQRMHPGSATRAFLREHPLST